MFPLTAGNQQNAQSFSSYTNSRHIIALIEFERRLELPALTQSGPSLIIHANRLLFSLGFQWFVLLILMPVVFGDVRSNQLTTVNYFSFSARTYDTAFWNLRGSLMTSPRDNCRLGLQWLRPIGSGLAHQMKDKHQFRSWVWEDVHPRTSIISFDLIKASILHSVFFMTTRNTSHKERFLI